MANAPTAQKVRTLPLPNGLLLEHYRLANGLQIYIVPDHSVPVFTFQAWYRVGSRDEKLDPALQRTGLAHFFEHMMFRGTPRFPDGAFDRVLTEHGVHDENATTWFDRTNYYESLPAEALSVVIDLEADRMQNLTLTNQLLETERSAVLGEYRMGKDNVDLVASDLLYETAFDVHPYRYTPIGTEEEIRSFTIAEAEAFYRTYYSPGNLSLMLVGDVDPQYALEEIEKKYGAITGQPVPRYIAPIEEPQSVERKAHFTHPQLEQGKVMVAYHIPGVQHPDLPALSVLQTLMTQGESSALVGPWIDTGLAVDVGGWVDQFQDPGVWGLSIDLAEETSAEQLLQSLDQVLAALPAQLENDPSIFFRAKNQSLLALIRQWDDHSSLAGYLGEFIGSTGDPWFGVEWVERLRKVQASDLTRVLRQYFNPHQRTWIYGKGVDHE